MDFKEALKAELDKVQFGKETSDVTLENISVTSDLAIAIMENACRNVVADFRKKLELNIIQHPLGSQELGDLVYSV